MAEKLKWPSAFALRQMLLVGIKMVQLLGKTAWQFLKKTVTYDPATPFIVYTQN